MIGDDVSNIKTVFERTKQGFSTGKTLELAYRETQLKNLIKGFKEMEGQVNDALKKDLGLTDFHCVLYSTDAILSELNHTLENQ